MKSEERHELQKNDLASGLSDLPSLWARHGNKVLLVIAAAFLIVAAVRYKRNQTAQREEQTRVSLASAWSGVEQLGRLGRGPASDQIDKLRGGIETDVNQAVQNVIDDSSATPAQLAWAWLARGELYWTMAHTGAETATPAATTAPSSQPTVKTPAEYLTLAGGAYGKIAADYADTGVPAKIARFSLAAIAEEQAKPDDARKQYKALIETTDLPEGDKSLAVARLAKLDTIGKPVLLLPATQPVAAKANFDSLLPPSMMGPLPPMPSSNSLKSAAPMQLGTPSAAPASTQPTINAPASTQP